MASENDVEGHVRDRKTSEVEERAFEVCHEGFSPRIEGVHDHLPLGRTCDLYPSVLEAGGRRCTDP